MKKVIFLHTQRTGGTSFRDYVTQKHIFPIAFRSYIKDDIIKKIYNSEKPFIEFEPGIYLEELSLDFNYYTILRSPIDRCLSWIELHSRIKSNGKGNLFNPRGVNDDYRYSEEFWEETYNILKKLSKNFSIEFNLSNTYVKSLTNQQQKKNVEEEDLKLAFNNIKRMSVTIFDKNKMHDSINKALDFYNFRSNRENYPVSMQGNNSVVDYCPQYVREFLAEVNFYDIQLYNYYESIKDEDNFTPPIIK